MTPYQIQLTLPLFAMALLAFIVLFTMGFKRLKAAKTGALDPRYYKLYRGEGEPEDIRQLAQNFKNQFEAPVLFYLAICLSLILKVESTSLLSMAWLYVALRYIHSYVHCTSNKIIWRFRIYLLSCLVLIAIWVNIALQIFSIPH